MVRIAIAEKYMETAALIAPPHLEMVVVHLTLSLAAGHLAMKLVRVIDLIVDAAATSMALASACLVVAASLRAGGPACCFGSSQQLRENRGTVTNARVRL